MSVKIEQIFVPVEHVHAVCLMDATEVEKRRVMVKADKTLVMLDLSDIDLVKALRERQNKLRKRKKDQDGDGIVLKDILGVRYTWTRDHTRKDGTISVTSHFKRVKDDCVVDHTGTPNVSDKHELAIRFAAMLVLQGSLKVMTLCAYKKHPTPLLPSWVPLYQRCACTETFEFEAGLTVDKNHHWHGFEIDLAVLCNGKLHTAIEIEKSHANSEKKRTAFKEHRIRNVQISADDIITACTGRNWCGPSPTDVVVENHPITAANVWNCAVCVPLMRCERNRNAARERLQATIKKKRDEFEAPLLADYDFPENGKFLKGYLYACALKGSSAWRVFLLNESRYHHRLNPNPRRFKVMVPTKSTIGSFLASLNEQPVSVKLANVSIDKPKACMTPVHYVFMRDDGMHRVFEGLELPGNPV